MSQLTASLITGKKAFRHFIENFRTTSTSSASNRTNSHRKVGVIAEDYSEDGSDVLFPDVSDEQWTADHYYLEEILNAEFKDQYPFPSLLLGMCDDQVPLILDLTNPAPGSILIVGDAHSGKTGLLRAILNSVIFLNESQKVNIHLIVKDQQDYYGISDAKHCADLLPVSDKGASFLIRKLKQELDLHRNKLYDTIHILAIDDIAQFLEGNDNRTFEELIHLIRHGARMGIWVVGTLSTRDIGSIDQQVIAAFRTKIISPISEQSRLEQLIGNTYGQNLVLMPGRQFGIPNGSEWIKIWMCE